MLTSSGAWGQSNGRKNLANFDTRPYHFGFSLAIRATSTSPSLTALPLNSEVWPIFRGWIQHAFDGVLHPVAAFKIAFRAGTYFQDRGLNYAFDGQIIVKRTEVSIWTSRFS